jgi:hypothetical protein
LAHSVFLTKLKITFWSLLLKFAVNRQYEFVTVTHLGLSSFLRKYNGDKLIDLLIMDIEGAELGILPILIGWFFNLGTQFRVV